MKNEIRLVLSIAKEVAYNRKEKNIAYLIQESDMDWQAFKDMAAYHGLTSFAYLSLKDYASSLPQSLMQVLTATYYYALRHTSFLENRFLGLFNNFENEGIALVPIKGMALLEDLYSEFPIRQSTDIDVLVQRGNIDRSCILLERLGFTKHLEGLKESYWREKQYHFVYIFPQGSEPFSLMVELHWDLDYPRERELLPQMFNRLRELPMQGRRVKVLSAEDAFFSLILHQRHFGKIICLRDACDIVRLLNKYSRTFDWEYVLTESRKSKICASVFFMLYQAKLWLGMEIPPRVFRELRVPLWKQLLIKRFIIKNSFLTDQNSRNKNSYLKAHFLLYDGFWEPVAYIHNIPQEQFAKFYGLQPYDKKTDFLYRNRILYILWKGITGLLSNAKQKR